MQFPGPLFLASSCKKSEAYFRALRWQGKRYCPRCKYSRKIYHLKDGRFKCGRCSFKFQEFTGAYLETLPIPFNELSHPLYFFVLGVPALLLPWLSLGLFKDCSEGLPSDQTSYL